MGHFPPALASLSLHRFAVGEGGFTRSPSAVNSFVVAGFFFPSVFSASCGALRQREASSTPLIPGVNIPPGGRVLFSETT